MNKNEELGFKAYYDQLTSNERVLLRNQFLSETGCAWPTFYNKKNNPDRFSLLEQAVIARILDKDVNFLFPKK